MRVMRVLWVFGTQYITRTQAPAPVNGNGVKPTHKSHNTLTSAGQVAIEKCVTARKCVTDS